MSDINAQLSYYDILQNRKVTMKVKYINPTVNPETPEIILNNVEKIEIEKVNRFDVEYDMLSCYERKDGKLKITELDTKIVIEKD